MKKILTIFTALFALQVSAQNLTYQAGTLPESTKIEKVLRQVIRVMCYYLPLHQRN